MTGILIFNQDRPEIALDTGRLYGGLHCGECFQCLIEDTWVNVRLEYDQDWVVLVRGMKCPVPYGSRVQM